jgi:hypothetical protein
MNFGAVEKQNKKGNILSLIAFLGENSPVLKKRKGKEFARIFCFLEAEQQTQFSLATCAGPASNNDQVHPCCEG